jgi:hypothetical protein
VVEGKSLDNVEMLGKQDPYVRVSDGGCIMVAV